MREDIFLGSGRYHRFSREDLPVPPAALGPIPAVYWDEELTDETIRTDIDTLYEAGFRSAYIIPLPKGFRPTTMAPALEPDYMTPAYLKHHRRFMEFLKEKHMNGWIRDEGG